jgi:hypothetical protein
MFGAGQFDVDPEDIAEHVGVVEQPRCHVVGLVGPDQPWVDAFQPAKLHAVVLLLSGYEGDRGRSRTQRAAR